MQSRCWSDNFQSSNLFAVFSQSPSPADPLPTHSAVFFYDDNRFSIANAISSSLQIILDALHLSFLWSSSESSAFRDPRIYLLWYDRILFVNMSIPPSLQCHDLSDQAELVALDMDMVWVCPWVATLGSRTWVGLRRHTERCGLG